MFILMAENLKQSVEEVDKDLAHSWINLSANVRNLASDLKLKAAGTFLAGDADHLSNETSRLCEHVERLHTDMIDLLENVENVETHGSIQEADVTCEDVEKEKIQIQRENHELRSDFKDIIKALFMWRDDPVERVRKKKVIIVSLSV
jgi:hypothetical protein|tara:strand:- start:17831 stop:18271 length:441 start_codon:yes stop_codon:yes gene_type:complete